VSSACGPGQAAFCRGQAGALHGSPDFYRKRSENALIPLKNLQDSRICHVLK
jgi:hypothetical protein